MEGRESHVVAAEPVFDIVDHIARENGGALSLITHVPSLNPDEDRVLRRLTDELASYEGNAIHTLGVSVGVSSPHQDYAVEAYKSLLRRYSFDRAPLAAPLRVRGLRVYRGDAGGPASEISRNLQEVVDGLLEALSENPNPNERLAIEVEVAPSPEVFRRLVESRWGLRTREYEDDEIESSDLRINVGTRPEFRVVVLYRSGLGRDGRHYSRCVQVTGRRDPRRRIGAIDFVLPCAMALSEPEQIRFRVSSQEMLESLVLERLPRYYDGPFKVVRFESSLSDITVTPELYRSMVRIPGLGTLGLDGLVLEGLQGDDETTEPEDGGSDGDVGQTLTLVLLHCSVRRNAPAMLSSPALSELCVMRIDAGDDGDDRDGDHDDDDSNLDDGNLDDGDLDDGYLDLDDGDREDAARIPPNVIEDLVRGICARHKSTLPRLCLLGAALSDQEVASLCTLLRDAESCRVRQVTLEKLDKDTPDFILTDAGAVALFSSLASFPASLRSLGMDYVVRRSAVANRVVAGIRSNTSLTNLLGLTFLVGADRLPPGDFPRFEREVEFWVRSNAKGRALVEAFVRGGAAVAPPPPRGDDNDGANSRAVVVASPPAGLMARVLHGCLRPSVRMDPDITPESSEMDLPVLYHFVRQLAPVPIPRAP